MDAVDVFPYLDWEKVSTLTSDVTNSHNRISEPSRRQTNDYTCKISRLTIQHRKKTVLGMGNPSDDINVSCVDLKLQGRTI